METEPLRPPIAPSPIAIDTGGTFTDCVYWRDGAPQSLKVPSTPADPGEAIVAALERLATPVGEVRHGTTVGTNALLERTGARVAFVTTAGFEDTIALGRQARVRLYDWLYSPPPPLAPAELRFGVPERTLPDGALLRQPAAAELATLRRAVAAAGAEAVAVSLLFSFANSRNEAAVREALRPLGLPVSVSHEILPEFREYERGATVLVNAYLMPRMGRYLTRLAARLGGGLRLQVMQSSGGIVAAAVAAREPVRTILSGPAGGAVGAHAMARNAGWAPILTFDMGGTSTDVALIDAAGPRTTNEAQVAGLPVAVPMLDIHTVGAGGGSIAHFDAGGALRVGPESAGADPGPICRGRGVRPTVTDANLLLGRLQSRGLLGGEMPLDVARAREIFAREKGPVATVEAFADGIVRVVEATMEKALRTISVERGRDPRECTLVAFGGAGPLHACALAEALRVPRVLVPASPGTLSALGILLSDIVRDYSRTVMLPFAGSEEPLRRHLRELEELGRGEMRAPGLAATQPSVDLRYAGQGYEINVAWPNGTGGGKMLARQFHRAHELRYGYADPARPIEIVNVRLRLVTVSPPPVWATAQPRPGAGRQAVVDRQPVYLDGRRRDTRVYAREALRAGDMFSGPAIVAEYSATTLVLAGWQASVDRWGNLLLTAGPARPAKNRSR